MVTVQIEDRGIRDASVLAAMRAVPRHRFVPPSEREHVYDDAPVPIGLGQTISQPYIVALMTSLVAPVKGKRVLEIGTGCGYQAAVLAEAGADVYTIEILPDLGRQAELLLEQLGYGSVRTRIGDGYEGWPEEAPFDAIVVAAAPPAIPPPLLEQVGVPGRIVVPVGTGSQDLVVLTRTESGFERRTVAPVRFVPMTGKSQR